MKANVCSLFLVLQLLVANSCKSRPAEGDIEQTLTQTMQTQQALPGSRTKIFDTYHMILEVELPGMNVRLQRWKQIKPVDESEIVVFIYKDDSFGLPILDNHYSEYWSFEQGGDLRPTASRSDFEKELFKGLNQVNYDTSAPSLMRLMPLIFSTLLGCRGLEENDSLDVITDYGNVRANTSSDTDSSCYQRNKKNWQEIDQIAHGQNLSFFTNAFWDPSEGRVYQIDTAGYRSKENSRLLRVYRTDCKRATIEL